MVELLMDTRGMSVEVRKFLQNVPFMCDFEIIEVFAALENERQKRESSYQYRAKHLKDIVEKQGDVGSDENFASNVSGNDILRKQLAELHPGATLYSADEIEENRRRRMTQAEMAQQMADNGSSAFEPAYEKTIEEVFLASGLEGGKRYRLKQMEKIVGYTVRTKDKVYGFREAVEILRDKGIITSGNGFWCFNDSMV